MKRVKRGQKIAWLAKEDKHGWALGLVLGDRTLWLRHLRFADRAEVERATGKITIVFIYLKNPKELQ
jgi:hypothetical protein